jgi:HlyD family secretion protein
VMVTAMTEGVIDQILVVAGQEVKTGQPLATLVDADARIALGDAEATVQLRKAEIASARAALTAARAQADQPVHLEAAFADAESLLAKAKREQVNLPFAIRAAESRLQLAKQDLEGKTSAADVMTGRSIQRAQSEFDSAAAAL